MIQTSSHPAEYQHDLGNGLHLDAFSLDPNMNEEGLAGILADLAKKPKPSQDKIDAIIRTCYVQWLPDMKLELVKDSQGRVVSYQIPAPLREYREALGRSLDERAKTNPNIFDGPVIVAEGEISNPLRVMQGGYFDFSATQLGSEPAKLSKDKNSGLNPGAYPEGKTVKRILEDAGLPLESRERYFGFAHLMWPANGKEFLLVNRAKGMGIAADCVSTPGSTPDIVLNNPGLGKPGFGVREYWSYHMGQEMQEEFALRWGDFWVEGINLYDDTIGIPFGAMNIYTEKSARQIAQGIHDAKPKERERVLTEHNVIFSMPPKAIPSFLERFPVFYSLYVPIRDALVEKGL